MGQSISKLLDNNSQNEELKDQMTSLQRQAEDESEMFYNEIIRSSHATSKQIPISTVMSKFQKIEVVVETNSSDVIVKVLNDTVKNVTSSSTSGIVSTLIGAAVQSLFGKSALDYSTEEGYTISIGLLGGIERLDYKISNYSFESKTWKSEKRSCMSMTIVTSACDVSALTLHDTKTIIQNCFSAISMLKKNEEDPEQEADVANLQLKMHEFLSSQLEREITRNQMKEEAKKKNEPEIRDSIEIFEEWMKEDDECLEKINGYNKKIMGKVETNPATLEKLYELTAKVEKKLEK